MTIREEKIERYEEALFILWADEVALQEGRDLERENAALRLDANFRAPEEVVRRGRELISRKLAARTARSVGRRAWKFVHTAALVCLFTTLAFSAAFAASPTFRANTLNLVIETFDEKTSYRFTPYNEVSELITNWVPSGFTLEDSGEDQFTSWRNYQDSSGAYIHITKAVGQNTTLFLDTENATLKNSIINDNPIVIAIKENNIQILITRKDNQAFVLMDSSDVSLDDLIEIINNLSF